MKSWQEILDILRKNLISLGDVMITPAVLLTAALILLATFGFSRLLRRMLRRNVFRLTHLNIGAQESILRILHYFIMLVGLFIAVQQIGVDLTTLAAIGAVLMVGVGLGLQNITSNFISAIILLFERPVQVGDFVEVSGVQGRIRMIKTRSSVVETLDNVSIIVPNSNFISQNVTNWSYRDSKVRIHISVGVSYGSDVDLVAETLLRVGRAHPEVLLNPEPTIQFLEFGDSSLNFVLLIWINDASRQYFVRSDLNFAVVKAFREEGITIAYPQRDLHIRSAVPLELNQQDLNQS